MSKFDMKDFLSKDPKVKYACAKQAVAISEKDPDKLYSELDFFVDLLDGKNKILCWTAMRVIGNLSKVDDANLIDKLIPKLVRFLESDSLITASNAVQVLADIAANRSKHRDEILEAFLKVEGATYLSKGKPSPECRNVVIGNVIAALNNFRDEIKKNKSLMKFLQRQTENTRPAVKKKAEILLASWEKK